MCRVNKHFHFFQYFFFGSVTYFLIICLLKCNCLSKKRFSYMRISPEFSAHIKKNTHCKRGLLNLLDNVIFVNDQMDRLILKYMFEMRYRYSLGAIWCSFYSFPSISFCHKRFHNHWISRFWHLYSRFYC